MEDSKKVENKKEDNEISLVAVIRKETDQFSNKNFGKILRSTSLAEVSSKTEIVCTEKKEDRRVIELSDERSKMALRKQLESESMPEERHNSTDYRSMEILQKLPPGTIVIKQESKYKEDSDYVRDSTETSSGGSSSTSGCGPGKVRRIHRAVRKNRGTVEIRRNPMRVTKKDTDKDFPRPRQRLLSAKRKESLLDPESNKRAKSSTMPYMNTRSVTRKLYNVGATYQAPTIRDETEWKEWPVHGMHERPVFHPQVGLAVEYLGRYFASLDGLSYREIIDPPEIEVVSVDPHCEILPSSTEKKRNKKARVPDTKASYFSEKSKSFVTCMHESLHSVLGYCSQIITPTYKNNVQEKLIKLNIEDSKSSGCSGNHFNLEMETVPKNESVDSKENLHKLIQNCNQSAKTRLFPAQKTYIAAPQKSISFSNLKTLQGSQIKIQDVVRTSKNPLILVNTSETKGLRTRVTKALEGNPLKSENKNTHEETLMDMSSIYKNPNNENSTENSKNVNSKRKVEFTVAKYLLENAQKKSQITKECNNKEAHEVQNKEPSLKTLTVNSNKTWRPNEASEIAKILSEYNKSTLKKPAIENQASHVATKNPQKEEIRGKAENSKQSGQENCVEKNMNIKFPQGKWRRFHLTVEKLKDLKANEKKIATGVQNKKLLFKDDQSNLDVSSNVSGTRQIEKQENIEPKQSLQELLENTAVLYCAATGTHQDDLANYINSLDAKQSIQWLETCESSIVENL